MESYAKEFIHSCYELLEQFNGGLSNIESSAKGDDHTPLMVVLHRLNKANGIVGYAKAEAVAASGERLLRRFENSALSIDAKTGLETLSQTLFDIFKSLENLESEGDGDVSELISRLDGLQPPSKKPRQKKAQAKPVRKESATTGRNVKKRPKQAEFLQEFLIEGHENLQILESNLLSLDQNAADIDSLSGIFRTLHTIKGSSAIVGLTKTEALVHASETLMGKLRNREIDFSADISTLLFKVVDTLREIFLEVERSETEGEQDNSALINDIENLQASSRASQSNGTKMSRTGRKTKQPGSKAEATENRQIVEPNIATPSTDALHNGDKGVAPPTVSQSITDRSIRVGIDLLDKFMDQVGELVLARNQVLKLASTEENGSLSAVSQTLNLVTSKLQSMVMRTRMQPIRNIWDRFPRMAHDLAKERGKKVVIEMEGAETELDRSMLEQIKDPLMHLVRNSVDHGIEPPDVRVANGKPEQGIIRLRAFNAAGKVGIEISDDGVGIDPQKVKEIGLKLGIVNREQLDSMSDLSALELIFARGFSTSEKVTRVSGRGVGMDIVKTNIERIGGAITVKSKPGQGTVIDLKIPLTLVIMPTLLIANGGEQYAIPQTNIDELLMLEGQQITEEIEIIRDVPVYRLRGNFVPLIFLGKVLNEDEYAIEQRQALGIVVITVGLSRFGLVVDEILDSEEIVVKPLASQLQGILCYSGGTILGNGKVALVLDVLGIMQMANLSAIREDPLDRDLSMKPAIPEVVPEVDIEETDQDIQTLLLFEDDNGSKMAMPLSKVARLEEITEAKIENFGGQYVVQYRGEIMPLISACNQAWDPLLKKRDGGQYDQPIDPHTSTCSVIIYSRVGTQIGIVVENILDIVDEKITVKGFSQRESVLFSTVIQDHVVEVVDIDRIVANRLPELARFQSQLTMEVAAGGN